MRRVAAVIVAFVFCGIGSAHSAQGQQAGSGTSALILPAGTKLELAVIASVWARTAKPGDPLYARTNFPVAVENQVAIPAGTYAQASIVSITEPTRRNSRATVEVVLDKIIFANGYTLELPGATTATQPAPDASAAKLTVDVSRANDLLLDNGAEFEVELGAPLTLDGGQVARAVPLTRAPDPGSFKSATLCRPTPGSPGTPGTPGTPDTIIPGSPGTPDTVIPGGPGMPDTVIPGTPATPDTVIPGSPGTPDIPGSPGIACPAAPMVIASEPVKSAPAPTPSKP